MIFSVIMAHEYICLGSGGMWLFEKVTSNICYNQDESTARVASLLNLERGLKLAFPHLELRVKPLLPTAIGSLFAVNRWLHDYLLGWEGRHVFHITAKNSSLGRESQRCPHFSAVHHVPDRSKADKLIWATN